MRQEESYRTPHPPPPQGSLATKTHRSRTLIAQRSSSTTAKSVTIMSKRVEYTYHANFNIGKIYTKLVWKPLARREKMDARADGRSSGGGRNLGDLCDPPTQPRSDRTDEQPPAVYRPVEPIRLAIEGCRDGLAVFVEGMVRVRASAASFGPPPPSVLRGRPSAGGPRRCAAGCRWQLPDVRSVSDDRPGRCRLRLVHDLAGAKDAVQPNTTRDVFGLRRPPERSDRAPDDLAAVGSPRPQRSRLTGSPSGQPTPLLTGRIDALAVSSKTTRHL